MPKVYDWKLLLVTLVLDVPLFIYELLHFEDFFDLLWLAIFGYLFVKGLHVSFNKKAHEEDCKLAAQGKHVYRKIFGKFAPIAPYGSLLLILLGGAVAVWQPEWRWLILLLTLSAVIYAVWLTIIYRKHLKLEQAAEQKE